MVTVLVHEVVSVAFVLLAHFLHDALNVVLGEVGAAQDDGFSAHTQKHAYAHALVIIIHAVMSQCRVTTWMIVVENLRLNQSSFSALEYIGKEKKHIHTIQIQLKKFKIKI